MILSILLMILILIIAPMLIGLVPVFFVGKFRRSITMIYLAGFITMLTFFQLLAVPIVIVDGFGFNLIVIIYSIILGVLALAGIGLTAYSVKTDKNYFAEAPFKRNLTAEEVFEWVLVVLVVLFQCFMFFRMASFDGDDAYYVVHSLLSTETGTLYRIRPYTGLSTGMDLRHALAVFPIWISYLARITGIHPTVVAHSLLGIILIPITYFIYFEIARVILRKEKKKIPVFMIFIAIMQIFGNVSIYTNATFFLTRTWQGKSVLANVAIPVTLWLLLNIYDTENFEKDKKMGLWFVLFMNNIVAAMCSTTSVFLMAMTIGLSGLILSIKDKNPQILLQLIITCIPLVAYGCMFLLI